MKENTFTQTLLNRIKDAQFPLLQETRQKIAFVPSPTTQQKVQDQAAAGQGPPLQQGDSANAIAPSGLTLDNIAEMVDQIGQAQAQGIQGLQNQLAEMRAAIPGPSDIKGGEGSGGGGKNIQNLIDRVAQLEQMLAASGAMAPPLPPPQGQAPAAAPPQQ